MINSLEKQYDPLIHIPDSIISQPANILVLGGGRTLDHKLPPNDQLSERSLGRVTEGIRLHRLAAGSKIVFSGSAVKDTISQAETAARAAMSLGISDSVIYVLDNPRNTKEESLAYISAFGNNKTLIVVTDAVHMQRAVRYFKKAGLNPVPAPTNHYLKQGKYKRWLSWLPSSDNIQKTEVVFHEIAGLLLQKVEK